MTPPTPGHPTAEDALDRAFDSDSSDESAERLAQDASLRAELEAAREAATEEAERPEEDSHSEYLDPKTVPPRRRTAPRMPSQKLYVNEDVAFPQKSVPTVRGLRAMLNADAGQSAEPFEAPTQQMRTLAPQEAHAGRPGWAGLAAGSAATVAAIATIAWFALRDQAVPAPPPAALPTASTPGPPASATLPAPTAAPLPTPAGPTSVGSSDTAKVEASAWPAISASARAPRKPTDFGGMQF